MVDYEEEVLITGIKAKCNAQFAKFYQKKDS